VPITAEKLTEGSRGRFRSPGPAILVWGCLVTLIALALQLGLGMIVNLYVQVPAADARAGFLQEIRTAPLGLTLHAVLGILLICAAILVLAGAFRARDAVLVTFAATGLVAMAGAFAAGELFVRNGENGVSLTMALLTGLAFAAYASALARAKTGQLAERPDH
jgi:hypothetical protein